MDLDLTLRVNQPSVPTESSTQTEKTSYEHWEQSNRLSLMFIKFSISLNSKCNEGYLIVRLLFLD